MSFSPTGGGRALPVAAVLGSCVSLQFGAAFAAQLFPQLGSWGTTLLRLLIAAVILVVLTRPRAWRWHRVQWREVVLFGGALAGMNGFFYASIDRIPLGTAVAIEFIGPLALSAVLSRRIRDLVWVGLALAGMVLLGAEGLLGSAGSSVPLDPLGVAFALIAGGFWAAYVLTSARVGRALGGTGGLAVGLVVASVVVAPFGLGGALTAVAEPALLLPAAGTALLASVIPYSLELAALRRLPERVFGVLLSMEPAVATVAGFLLLGQTAGPLRLAAVALVVAASIGSTVSAGDPAPQKASGRANSAVA